MPTMLEAAGFKRINPSDAKPGDIVIDYEIHAMIYAGNGKVWDQSSCVGDKTGTTRSRNISNCLVYRAP